MVDAAMGNTPPAIEEESENALDKNEFNNKGEHAEKIIRVRAYITILVKAILFCRKFKNDPTSVRDIKRKCSTA